MPPLLLSYPVVLGQVAVILGLVLTSLLFRLRNKDQHTWWLSLLFISFTLMMAGFSVMLSVPEEWSYYGILSIVLIDVGVLCMVQFAYSFPSVTHPREARIVLIANLLCLPLIGWALNLSLVFDEDGWAQHFGSWVGFALAAQLLRLFLMLWLVGVWIRKIMVVERGNRRFWLTRLLFPRSKTGKTIRAFLSAFSIVLILPLVILIEFMGITDANTTAFLFSLTVVMLFSAFFITYINYMPEQSSFMMKLVGVTLVLVLLAIALTGFFATLITREDYHRARLADMEACRARIEGTETRIPESVRYLISREIGGSDYAVHFARDPAFRVEGLEAIDRRMRERLQIAREFTERSTLGFIRLERDWSVTSDGEPILGSPLERGTDLDLFLPRDHDLHYDFTIGDRLYQVGFSSMDYRRHMHGLQAKTALVMLLASVGVLLFYPIFFDRAITRPISSLIRGLHQVNAGRMNVQVPVHAHDEIGYVTAAFNHMVTSIAEARDLALKEERERTILEAENARKTRELEEARRLQLSMLPRDLPRCDRLLIAAYTDPATEVGGDYYDFHQNDRVLTIAIGDATGHGLQAGTMVAATKGLFQALAPTHAPVPFLHATSRALGGMGFQAMFMAMLVARFEGNRLTMTSAGMPYALHHRAAEDRVETIRLKGLPLGSGIDFPYEQQDIDLAAGDTILLHSDGFEERFDPDDQIFGPERVHAAFAEVASLPPDRIIEHLVQVGRAWGAGRPSDDDTTFVVLQRV